MWTLVLILVALGVSASAFGAARATVKVSANMDARQVVPQKPKGNVARAKGTFNGTLTSKGSRWTLSWQLAYSKLDHPTLVIADIHYGKQGKFGPVIVRLCAPCKSSQKGTRPVPGTWVPAIKAGNTFITLITGQNPNGEVRGQIKAR